MPDEPLLRQLARAAIERGAILRGRPERFWGGRGTGEACTICRRSRCFAACSGRRF